VSSHRNRDLIVATMEVTGFDRAATAKIIGCCGSTVTRQMHMAAADKGKSYVSQKGRGGRAKGSPQIQWNAQAIMKLTAILASKPIPPNPKIALEMGVSLQALQTAMSRFNLSPHTRSKNVKREEYRKDLSREDNRRMRNCLCCEKPFGSEGNHNRLCPGCNNTDGLIDVTEFSL
jgi:hypothetical protein